ncbi:MAG: PQQ-binding-like beta-propeller repeat protein [Chthoniobacterales bacterium]
MSTLFRLTIIILLFVSPAIAEAVKDVSGHREGSIQIPGREFPLIAALEESGGKEWTGSIIIQRLGVKGAPLADFAAKRDEISLREAPLVAFEEQLNVGGIYSSPLVVNGVVYFGSSDGNLYALE